MVVQPVVLRSADADSSDRGRLRLLMHEQGFEDRETVSRPESETKNKALERLVACRHRRDSIAIGRSPSVDQSALRDYCSEWARKADAHQWSDSFEAAGPEPLFQSRDRKGAVAGCP